MTGRWVILVDGRALEECSVDPSLPGSERMTIHLARALSRLRPLAAVALARLGDLASLRRFEAGRELAA